ncbi:MAG: winged helix-turn-helix domain-containing protein [Limimaricola soesokkakensis]|jgi:two-component system response regulator QseB|uniref:Transcriptional regulatory protein QseB n=1 Tax=Limimaricola soesokkakensis TaxID=1343159 RepID=A0A1X7A403_9RHOB|nr:MULTISPECIES: response regulator transcription factor [Limimaricola]PSK80848.1 two-component system response regulator QseB [Limimaricola soesokkakensis]WPY96971.1 response regulator transcription factor [Limimaricola variabilis]SLN69959.1 Transcriptional regulatory protein QseB [Limimaricola soesokkakensis]
MRVLIVEDDETLADGLSVGLRLQGFTPELVTCCADAREALAQGGFSAVVLDLMLPDGSGLDLLAGLRAGGDRLPVLLLTALDQVRDRIGGLDAGADDYLGKPFDLGEVSARLRAIIRRAEGRASALLEWNGLRLDPSRMSGEMDGRELRFSRREFSVLRALIETPGVIVEKDRLEERLYGWQEGVESNAVEVHVHKLRAKLGAGFIETVRGVGYRLAEPRP